jgi:glycosyltransferase involved in cell wall biosynthesis
MTAIEVSAAQRLARSNVDPLEWPMRFARRHGRKPRVLHICNVANYAYANARLMRQYGVEADVIDPDFYHIMATPEWYEAEVTGDYGNEFFPDWKNLEFQKYRRPDWFIQGPRDMVLQYLALRSARDFRGARRVRRTVEQANNLRAYTENRNELLRRVMASSAPFARFAKSVAKRTLFQLPALPAAPSAVAPPVVDEEWRTSVPEVLYPLYDISSLLRTALAGYDMIQGYTVAGMYPAFLRLPNFTAYELGTLRGLPFEDSPMGHICAWTYRNAPAVFVTNVDCIASARRLGIAEERIHPVLHAFDCESAFNYQPTGKLPDGVEVRPPFFFAPARHHWRDGNASWLKGNDVVIRAAGLLKRAGYDFRILFVEWGQELELSKALIEEEDLNDRVVWTKPLSRPSVWKIYSAATAVVDQFRAAAFGGVALEAMALGKRLVTRFDNTAAAAFFRTSPPICNAATPDAVCRHLSAILEDPDDRRGIGAAAREWMRSEHSVERQLRTQFAVFSAMTGE